MTRRPTPSIMDAVLVADVAPDRTALRTRLRWDYSQVAPVDRRTVEDAAVDILANGQRATAGMMAIGSRLLEVKRMLPHGQFSDWCSTEFDMSQRSAQIWMNAARAFEGKSAEISLLSDSSLALLAAPSTPEPARLEAIEEAQATGKSPSVQRTKEIIAQHKPGPAVPPIPAPTAKEYSAAVQAAQPAMPVYSAWNTPPIPGWDDDDEAEYQALMPLWQKPALEIPLTSSDRITRRRVAERLSLERMDNLRHTLQERRRELWLEERRQERSASAISNPDPVVAANAAAATVQIIEYNADAPLPAWAEEPDRIRGYSVLDDIALRDMQPAPPANAYAALTLPDGRIPAARNLMALYGAVIDSEEQYGELTGRFSDTLTIKRELTNMIAHLADLIAAIEHPEEVSE